MNPVVMRQLTLQDLPYLERTFPEPETGSHSRRLSSQERGFISYLCAEVDGVIAGIILVRWRGPVDSLHLKLSTFPEIGSVFVLPEYRSRGLGKQLLNYAESQIQQKSFKGAGLLIKDNNSISIALHLKEGYVPVGAAQYGKRDPDEPRTYYTKVFSK